MKTLARIVCVSAVFLIPVPRIGAGDDKQTPSLFDQVRQAISKLKAGTSQKEAERLLHVDKLNCPSSLFSSGFVLDEYRGFNKESQSLLITFFISAKDSTIMGATLRDGDKIVARFDAHKK